MKPIKILQAVTIIAFAAVAVGCTSSRYSSSYPPLPSGPGASFSLIIDSYPGIAANRYADGRYYYRNPQGYTYWRGNDSRYYLDRSFVGRNYHSHRDYNDWRRHGNYTGRRHRN